MFLRRLCWGRVKGAGEGVRCCGASGGGVLGSVYTPTKPPLLSVLGRELSGLSEVPRVGVGGKNYLHTATVSSTAFTWSRRRWWWRRRVEEEDGALLSVSISQLLSSYSGSDGGGAEVRDDEVRQVEVNVGDGGGGSGGGGGGFLDTGHHHRHHNIKERDVGVTVNVGESVISTLNCLYHIPREQALAMVRSDMFLLVSDTSLLRTLYYLKDHNISCEQLTRIPWIMLHSADSLESKFAKLQEPHLFKNPEDGLGFCWFSLQQIKNYQRQFAHESKTFPDHLNRVYYLAERLEVEVAVLTEKMVKPRQILKMDINRVNHIIDIFKRYGVQMQDVVSDLWVFNHNAQVTEDRLRQAAEAGCVRAKPWICHSSPQVFERYIERWRAKSQVLGEDGDLVSYLSARLSCPPHEIQAALSRNPGLKVIHVGKIKSVMDHLFAEGFTPEDLRSCLRVLQYSEQRTRKRIKELKSFGYFPFPIRILYKRPETYYNIVQRIKRKQEEEERKKIAKEEEENLKSEKRNGRREE